MPPSRYRPGDRGTTDRDAAVDPFTVVVYYGGVQVVLLGLPVLWLAFLWTTVPYLGTAVLVAVPAVAVVVAVGRVGWLPGGWEPLSTRRLGTGEGYRAFCRRAAHIQTTLAVAVVCGVVAGMAGVAAAVGVTALLAAGGTALAGPLARAAPTARAAYYLVGLAVAVTVVTRLPILSPSAPLAVAAFAAAALIGVGTTA